MPLLAIETTCDETAAAVIARSREVLSSVVATQEQLHARWRGVVPEVASRAHVERIIPVIDEAVARAGIARLEIEGVGVAVRPGLVGSLLVGLSAGKAIAVEEFLEGHEGFYDTISIGGVVAVDFVSHYFPGVLEAMRTRWISPQIVVTNRIGDPSYDELEKLGQDALRALGVQTSPTHMEWFFGPKGLKFSEIGCRPPGVGVWDLYAAANEFDIFAAWAEAIVHGRISQRPSRRFSAGMIALRPDRDGRISGCEGVEELQRRYGNNLIDVHFPPVGTATQGVEAGYMANAWVRMKHEDFDQLRAMLDWVGENVKLRAN